MKIKVTNCSDCPFCVKDINTECVGNDTLLHCNLASYHDEESFIISYDSFDYSEPVNTCDYCNNQELTNYVEEFDKLRCTCKYKEITIETPDWCMLHEINIIKNE